MSHNQTLMVARCYGSVYHENKKDDRAEMETNANNLEAMHDLEETEKQGDIESIIQKTGVTWQIAEATLAKTSTLCEAISMIDNEISMIMIHAPSSKEQAILVYNKNHGDMVDAILVSFPFLFSQSLTLLPSIIIGTGIAVKISIFLSCLVKIRNYLYNFYISV